jgi:hypothetical protein
MCIYAYIYIHMHIYICICMYVCIYSFMNKNMRIDKTIYIYNVFSRTPYYTPAEYKEHDDTLIIAPAVALPLVLAVIITWATDKNKRKQGYLVLVFASSSCVLTVWFLIMAITRRARGWTNDQMFCINNAIPRRLDDGPSMCVVQGIYIYIYTCICIYIYLFAYIYMYINKHIYFLHICIYKAP